MHSKSDKGYVSGKSIRCVFKDTICVCRVHFTIRSGRLSHLERDMKHPADIHPIVRQALLDFKQGQAEELLLTHRLC